jgi:hypothetical protein
MKFFKILTLLNALYLILIYNLSGAYNVLVYGSEIAVVTLIYIITYFYVKKPRLYKILGMILIILDIITSVIIMSVLLFSYIYML